MSEGPVSSGITEEHIRSKLVEKLQATHVEITDVSGMSLKLE
jgi:hypothetical protein